MKKIWIAALALCLGVAGAAVEVVSIKSEDLSKTSNQVTVRLSGPSQYGVQNLPDGMGIRIVVQNAEKPDFLPDYPRLSRVIDRISMYNLETSLIIDIRTMGKYPVTHTSSGNGSRITVTIGTKPEPAQKPVRPPEPGIQIPPAPASEEESPPETEEGLFTQADSAVTDTLIFEPGTSRKEIPATGTSGEQATRAETKKRPFISLYVIIGIALILCVWVILKFFHKKKPADLPDSFVQTPEGTIILMDDDARIRMAEKLHEQGWNASQIARELKLNIQQVEAITAGTKGETSREDDENDA